MVSEQERTTAEWLVRNIWLSNIASHIQQSVAPHHDIFTRGEAIAAENGSRAMRDGGGPVVVVGEIMNMRRRRVMAILSTTQQRHARVTHAYSAVNR